MDGVTIASGGAESVVVCDELEIPGCMDATACNYNDAATFDDGSCTFADVLRLRRHLPERRDGDGVCDELETGYGRDGMQLQRCRNFRRWVMHLRGCVLRLRRQLLNDANGNGLCDELKGCTHENAPTTTRQQPLMMGLACTTKKL